MRYSSHFRLLIMFTGLSISQPLSAELLFNWTLDVDGLNDGSGSATMDIFSNASISSSCSVVGEGSLQITAAGAPDDGGSRTSNPIRWSTFENGDTRTISFWAKPSVTQEGNATMFSVGNDSTGERFDIKTPSNFRVEIQGAGQSTGVSIQDGRWHHIAVVVPFEDSEMKDIVFYLDGVEITNGSSSGQEVNTATNSARLGDSVNGSGDRDFDGFIDDVRIYNTALSVAEIEDLAKKRLLIGCFEASVESFDFDELQTVELSWDAVLYSSLELSDDQGGAVLDAAALSSDGIGAISVSPTTTTTYTLTVVPSSGGPVETRTVTVTVVPEFFEPLSVISFGLDGGDGNPFLTVGNLISGESYRLFGGSDLIGWTALAPAITADSSEEVTFSSTDPVDIAANPVYFFQVLQQ